MVEFTTKGFRACESWVCGFGLELPFRRLLPVQLIELSDLSQIELLRSGEANSRRSGRAQWPFCREAPIAIRNRSLRITVSVFALSEKHRLRPTSQAKSYYQNNPSSHADFYSQAMVQKSQAKLKRWSPRNLGGPDRSREPPRRRGPGRPRGTCSFGGRFWLRKLAGLAKAWKTLSKKGSLKVAPLCRPLSGSRPASRPPPRWGLALGLWPPASGPEVKTTTSEPSQTLKEKQA